jgi:hypothetical protein
MDLEQARDAIVAKVYHIVADRKVALHKHADKGEVFSCMGGSGFGVLETSSFMVPVYADVPQERSGA